MGRGKSIAMAELYHKETEPQYVIFDRKNYVTHEDQIAALEKSHTIYVGNLSFFSKELQIYETFSMAGPIKRLIMGLNSISKTPCGFCFVEYYTREHMQNALKYLNDTVCDARVIRCDADPGFIPGRQFGRGSSGGQVRDEWRTDYDPARGRFIPPELISQGQNKRPREEGHRRHYDNRGARRFMPNKGRYIDRRGGRRDSRGYGGSTHYEGQGSIVTSLSTGLNAPR